MCCFASPGLDPMKQSMGLFYCEVEGMGKKFDEKSLI